MENRNPVNDDLTPDEVRTQPDDVESDTLPSTACEDVCEEMPETGVPTTVDAPPFGAALRVTNSTERADPPQPAPVLWTQLDQKAPKAPHRERNPERGYAVLYACAIVFALALIVLGAVMVYRIHNTYPNAAYGYSANPDSGFEYSRPGSDDNDREDERSSATEDALEEWKRAVEESRDNEASPTPSAKPVQPRKSYSLPQIGAKQDGTFDANHLFADISAFVSPSVVMIASELPITDALASYVFGQYTDGSGIVLSTDGFIVTNNHVIAESERIFVYFSDTNDELEAEVVGRDSVRDLAVLKVNRNDCKPARFGDSDKLRPGDIAIAIGNALGEGSGTTTQGIISAVNRKLTLDSGHRQEFIQTDAAINPGNSGGALVNAQGQVIGINTLKYTVAGMDEKGSSIPAEGIGYAIPINDVMPIVENLIVNGEMLRPALGVSVSDAEAGVEIEILLEQMGAPKEGVYVAGVVKGGPADNAGIAARDVIIAIEGKPVKTVEELTDEVASFNVGDKIVLTVWREGKTLELETELINMDALNYRD